MKDFNRFGLVCGIHVCLLVSLAAGYSGGDGSEGYPYKISSVADWQELIVASTAPDEHFILTETIDFGGAEIKPVGYEAADPNFLGQFDGQGFAIRNAVIYLPHQDYVGLFGFVGSGGKICNLNVIDADITGNGYVGGLAGVVEYGTLSACCATGSVSGGGNVGGLVGLVNSGTLSACSANGSVSGGGYYVGGLVGRVSSGTLSACSATGSVSGYSNVGGLAGHVNSGTLSACSATGSVSGGSNVGGLVGHVKYGTLSACYATSLVSGASDVGGLAGYNGRSQVIHCYSTGRPSGSNYVGGLCGYKITGTGYADTGNFWNTETSQTTASAMGIGKTMVQMKTLATFTNAGWDFEMPGQAGNWFMPDDSYPILTWQLNEPIVWITIPDVRGLSIENAVSLLAAAGLEAYETLDIYDASVEAGLVSGTNPGPGVTLYTGLTRIYLLVAKETHYSGGDGSEGNPYKIGTIADWLELINASTAPNEYFKLTQDLDFGGVKIIPVGYEAVDPNFLGQFDGQGFAIRNATIHLPSQDFVGLFRTIGSFGQICNLNIENLSIAGADSVGGLAGTSAGIISICSARGLVNGSSVVGGLVGSSSGTMSGCTASSLVNGITYVGGLAGSSSGTITGCSASESVNGISYVGGLVGQNPSGTISNCFAIGAVNGDYTVGGLTGLSSGTISGCTASGSVNGDYYIGGLAGQNPSGTISNCSAIGAVNGDYSIGGLTGSSSGMISCCSASGSVSGRSNVGGLAGSSFSTISCSSASGSVKGSDSRVGGLVGYNSFNTISDCTASGSVNSINYVGGLSGYNYLGKVIHCYSTGKVTGTNNVGGLCGYKVPGTGYEDTGNFWDRQTSQQTASAMGVGKTTAQMKTLATFTDAGWDFGVPGQAGHWFMPDSSYPLLIWQSYTTITIPDVRGLSIEEAVSLLAAVGLEVYETFEVYDTSVEAGLVSGTNPASGVRIYPDLTRIYLFVAKESHYSGGDGSEGNPYKISTIADWQELIVASTEPNEHFILTETIDFGGAEILPVGYEVADPNFWGQFDGQGFAIRNATIHLPSQDFVGLFRSIGSGGQICNLSVVDVDITGRNYIGGLAGYNAATLSNCHTTGPVSGVDNVGGLSGYSSGTISNCTSEASVHGSGDGIGGLAGKVSGSIAYCTASGPVDGVSWTGGLAGYSSGTISDCTTNGSINGSSCTGGLVGFSEGTISDCTAMALVSSTGDAVGGLVGCNYGGGTISNCAATGSVSGNHRIGGLIGSNSNGKVFYCYSTGRPTGTLYVGGLCGLKNENINYQNVGNFWDTQTSGMNYSAMGTGKTTIEMMTLSTFMDAGWDFEETWTINEGSIYPQLNSHVAVAAALPIGYTMNNLSYFLNWWLMADCAANGDCDGADLDGDGVVDLADWAVFASNWLAGQ